MGSGADDEEHGRGAAGALGAAGAAGAGLAGAHALLGMDVAEAATEAAADEPSVVPLGEPVVAPVVDVDLDEDVAAFLDSDAVVMAAGDTNAVGDPLAGLEGVDGAGEDLLGLGDGADDGPDVDPADEAVEADVP